MGRVVSTYVAPEAPWHHNGPTNIRADRYTPDGRSFKRMSRFFAEHGSISNAIKKGLPFAQAVSQAENSPIEEIEITQAIKNADIAIVPHPFPGLRAGNTVVLLDPVGAMTEKLYMMHEAGEDIGNLLHTGHISLGVEKQGMKCSPGVVPVGCRWKLT